MSKISEHMKLWRELGMMPVVEEEGSNMDQNVARGTLQEFVEWAQGNYRGQNFVVVSERGVKGRHKAHVAICESGYGYVNRALYVRLGLDATNDFYIADAREFEEWCRSLLVAGIYFMYEPNEEELAIGMSRLRVNGAKAWIAHPQQELTTLNVAWKFE